MTSAQPDSYAKGPTLESNAPVNPGYQLPTELRAVRVTAWKADMAHPRHIPASMYIRIADDATGDLYPRVRTPIGRRGIGESKTSINAISIEKKSS
ncbi:hypothetical protein An12g10260 [Aspergillus niger]|uniref:Uncharacterized protein n=2 Tax=Aspergillus niger TaxID=5061 RepID=A2R0Y3_ASPNC|nr:hypothetical protein An12g10260 [Aspergillus niger]CAL00926.1 hypothetical protein An12g10260 [Aspergillus niger]